MHNYFLNAENLVLGYRGIKPITKLPFSFSIPASSITALVGLNGSGKSTLISGLVGGNGIACGTVWSYGKNHSEISAAELPNLISVVPQDAVFPDYMKVQDFLEIAFLPKVGIFGSVPSIKSQSFRLLLEQLGLARLLDKKLCQLSAGEKQRASLARALLQETKLMVLDEPTNHLDIRGSRNFWQALLAAKESRQLDILLSTHDFEFVRSKCDWVIALKEGNLFFCGPKDTFFREQKDQELVS